MGYSLYSRLAIASFFVAHNVAFPVNMPAVLLVADDVAIAVSFDDINSALSIMNLSMRYFLGYRSFLLSQCKAGTLDFLICSSEQPCQGFGTMKQGPKRVHFTSTRILILSEDRSDSDL